MILKITPIGAILLIVVFALYAWAMIVARKGRNKLIDEGKIIQRESAFWDKSETFTIQGVTLQTIYNDLSPADMKAFVGAYELQPENSRIVFVHNGYKESYTATIRQLDSTESGNTFRFMINQYKYSGSKPNEQSLNILYTAIEKIFLNHDPNVKVVTEYVDRKTKKSLF